MDDDNTWVQLRLSIMKTYDILGKMNIHVTNTVQNDGFTTSTIMVLAEGCKQILDEWSTLKDMLIHMHELAAIRDDLTELSNMTLERDIDQLIKEETT